MFGRVKTLLSRIGGGSLRKRLYVRLSIVAVLLCASVWCISYLQNATRNSKQNKNKQVATNSKNEKQPKASTKPASRRPQPVPGNSQAAIPSPEEDYSNLGDGSSSNTLTDRDSPVDDSVSDETESDSTEEDSTDDPSSRRGSRWADYAQRSRRGTYSVLSDEQEETADEEDSEPPTGDEKGLAEDETATANSSNVDTSKQKTNSSYSLADSFGETTEGGDTSDRAAEEIANDTAVEGEPESDSEQQLTSEPGLLIAAQDDVDSSGGESELASENSASLTETAPERSALQPLRSSESNTSRDARSTTRSSAPSLLTKTPSAQPIRVESESGNISLDPQSVPAISSRSANTSAELLGVQTQQVTIEKFAPDEVQVGRPARFEIIVRNLGQSTANNVLVIDRVPEGSVLVETNPPAANSDGVLTWDLGSMEPGSDAQLTVTVTPQIEGEISSVATVTFAAKAAARTVSTKPVLKVDVQVPQQVLIGDWVNVVITVRNEGSGPARGVVIEADIPEGLSHPAGRELEHGIGTLRSGDEQPLTLILAADKAGNVAGMIRVHDDGNVDLKKPLNLEIVAPQLAVGVEGPKLRYLGRQATYTLSVANNGTATANNVELIAVLPPNLQFVSADKLGQYDLQQHAVYWNLEQLPANKVGSVRLVTLPVQEGDRKLLRAEAHADLAQSVETPHDVTVSSIAELAFSIADSADPIEVGTDTIYEIEVFNQGSKADSNVVLAIGFPEELQPLKGEGPTKGQVSGQQIQFEPLGQLAAGDSVIYRVQAKGAVAGDPRIVVRLVSDQMPKPVSKEESTKVYSD